MCHFTCQATGGAHGLTIGKGWVDRRKYERFDVPLGAFVVLGLRSMQVGRITDISFGGLAFQHVDKQVPTDPLHELDLLHVENSFCLKNVPCETISQPESCGSPFGSFIIRECAVQFGDLTADQMSGLEDFIRNHTIRRWF